MSPAVHVPAPGASMRNLRHIFLTGLLTVLPAVVTIYIVYWIAAATEAALGALIRLVVPNAWYVPGMGLAVAVVLTFLVGLMGEAWMLGGLVRLAERGFERIPVVKSVFGGVRDLFAFVTGGQQAGLSRTVHVALTQDVGLIGFVTRDEIEGLGAPGRCEGRIAVYLPMSYQIGGYTVLVPRSLVTPLDMPAQDALRLVLTACMTAPVVPPRE
jgi:uncharacterized membrane protein